MFDSQKIQPEFPILQRFIHENKRLVYLDNAATSQKPLSVIEAITEYYTLHNANVHRGIHQLGDESTKLFHASRRQIAEFFGAESEEFIAVRNTTEAINQVAYTWGEQHLQAGDVILTTQMDHHSNIVPWQELVKRKRARLEFVPVTESGRLDLAELEKMLASFSQLKLVALPHVSNTLGTLNPVEHIITLVRQKFSKAKILIDGAQAVPHLSVKFHALDADFYVVSAHKMLGPMGIGGLFVKKELLSALPPFLFGGGMINEVTEESTTFAEDLEERFTAGTPDLAGLVGWAKACAYLSGLGMDQVLAHDQKLVLYAIKKLSQLPQLQLIGPVAPPTGGVEQLPQLKLDRVGSVAFIYQGVHAHDVGQILDSEGVAVRSGHHCTMPLHTKFNWTASVRASFQVYNTTQDIDDLVRALQKVHQVFGK